MGWIFLEAGVALAIGVFIVWWTIPRKPRDDGKDRNDPGQ